MKELLKSAIILLLLAGLCACAGPESVPGTSDPGSMVPGSESSMSGVTSDPEASQHQPTEPEALPKPAPEQFGLSGEYAALFQAMVDQDTSSWSLSIPCVAVRGMNKWSDRETIYFCTVQVTHYDIQDNCIVDSGGEAYRAVVTLSTGDSQDVTCSAFSSVLERETISTLKEIGMTDLAQQLESGDFLPVVWEMPDAEELLSEYCDAAGLTLTRQ